MLTTNYDDVLERAFAEAESRSMSSSTRRGGASSSSSTCAPDGERVPIDDPAPYREFALEERSVILKIHGDVDREDRERDTFVVTEDHYIDYLAGENVRALIPAYLMRGSGRATCSSSATRCATGTCA